MLGVGKEGAAGRAVVQGLKARLLSSHCPLWQQTIFWVVADP